MLFEKCSTFCYGEVDKNRFCRKIYFIEKKIVAAHGDQIKVMGSQGMSLYDFETIGQVVSEKIVKDFPQK